jgi:hypothetical protein
VCFRFLPHFPFLSGESDAQSLYAQRILDTLDFSTPTTEAMSLTVIDVCSLRANNLCPFLRSNVHFHTRKNKNYPRVKNQDAFAKDTSCQLKKRQTFPSEPVRTGLQTGSY